MHNDLKTRLLEAIGTGEVIGITYHGGRRSGAFRQIVPIRMEGDHVRARCYTSNAVKAFALAKIELSNSATPAEGQEVWSMPPAAPVPFANLGEAATYLLPKLEAKGWHVEHGPCEDGEAIRIFARLKTGKPRRSAAATFAYEAKTFDLGVTVDGEIVRFNERLRVRPWLVHANGKTRSWARIDVAVRAFMAAAGLSVAGAG